MVPATQSSNEEPEEDVLMFFLPMNTYKTLHAVDAALATKQMISPCQFLENWSVVSEFHMVSSQNRATFKSSVCHHFFHMCSIIPHTVVVTCFANIIYIYIYTQYIHTIFRHTQKFFLFRGSYLLGSQNPKTPKPGAPGDLTKSEQVTCWLRPRHPRLG